MKNLYRHLPEPHDRMPFEQVLKWKRRAKNTNHPEDWIRVAYCVGRGVGRVVPDEKERRVILELPEVLQWAFENVQQSRWAAYAKGIILFYGMGVYEKDDVASLHAFQAGFGMKCPHCTVCLAMSYRDGDGVKKDQTRFVELLQVAISYGSLYAKICLAEMYEKGYGVKKDYREAFQLYSDGADYFLLGMKRKARCLANGIGVKKDLHKAKEVYQHLSRKGFYKATYDLAMLMLLGTPQDRQKAVVILKRGVRDGDAECTIYLGAMYMNGDTVARDEQKGYSLFEQASNLGVPRAYLYMALYHDGFGGCPRDMGRAVELFTKAAEMGESESMKILGLSYIKGLRGLSKDVGRGWDLLKRAALSNEEEATRIVSVWARGSMLPEDVDPWGDHSKETSMIPFLIYILNHPGHFVSSLGAAA